MNVLVSGKHDGLRGKVRAPESGELYHSGQKDPGIKSVDASQVRLAAIIGGLMDTAPDAGPQANVRIEAAYKNLGETTCQKPS
jgi:hypothetical protein